MIHCSEEDGTSQADGIQVAVKGIQAAGGDVEVYDYAGSHARVLQRPAPRGLRRRSTRQAAWRRTLEPAEEPPG